LLQLLAFLVVGAFTDRPWAAEGGAGVYAPGSFSSFMDAVPTKPGFAAFNYFTLYSGSAAVTRSLPLAGEIGAGVQATVYVDTVGGFWITPLELLGGHYAVGVAIPLIWNTVSAQVSPPAGGTVSRSDSVNGLSDIEFWPIVVTWPGLGGDLNVGCYGGIYAPTGGFEDKRLANHGHGYWTFAPGVLASYLSQKNGIELTGYVGYDFTTKNTTTDYHSGQVFHFDGTAAWHFLPVGKGVFGAGATGFYLQQTTGDSGSGARLGSFKVMTAGVGPAVSYAAHLETMDFAASVTWLPQLSAENTLKGNYLWTKVSVSF
jgi:hypothetical protein